MTASTTTIVRDDFVKAFDTTMKAETAIVQSMGVVAKQSGELGKAVDTLAINMASWMANVATDGIVPSDKDIRSRLPDAI